MSLSLARCASADVVAAFAGVHLGGLNGLEEKKPITSRESRAFSDHDTNSRADKLFGQSPT